VVKSICFLDEVTTIFVEVHPFPIGQFFLSLSHFYFFPAKKKKTKTKKTYPPPQKKQNKNKNKQTKQNKKSKNPAGTRVKDDPQSHKCRLKPDIFV